MMRYVLALDFGASSGRAMLAGFDGSRITLQEVHRFANEPVSKDGRLYWNVPQLMEELEQGLQAGYAIAPYESIAIDTWGVDYGMLGADGTLLELPRHYGRQNRRHFAKGRTAPAGSGTLPPDRHTGPWRSTRCFSCFVSGTAAALTSVPRFCQCRICLRIC